MQRCKVYAQYVHIHSNSKTHGYIGYLKVQSTKQSPSRGGAPAVRIKTLEKELTAAKKVSDMFHAFSIVCHSS